MLGIVLLFPFDLYAQEVSTFYRVVGVGVPDARLFVLRLFQILWSLFAVGALGALIFGLVRMRSSYEDLGRFENAKRIVLFSAIAFVASLLVFGVITFFYLRISAQYRQTSGPVVSAPIGTGFSELRGPFSKIEQHYPLRNERDVSRNSIIVVTFREKLKKESIIDSNGALSPQSIQIQEMTLEDKEVGDPLSATATLIDGDITVRVDPVELLGREGINSTKYRVTLSSAILNEKGDSIFGETGAYSWVFYVGEGLDSSPPQVESVFPAIGKGSVGRNALVQVTFTKSIDPSVLDGRKVELLDSRKK